MLKIQTTTTNPIVVSFPDGSAKTFSDKEAAHNHFKNKIKSLENCIAHYLSESEKMTKELEILKAQEQQVKEYEE
jgi:hypothetical protein